MPQIANRYVGKIDTVALLLLGGIEATNLKEWYAVTDSEITQARKKIEALKSKGVVA